VGFIFQQAMISGVYKAAALLLCATHIVVNYSVTAVIVPRCEQHLNNVASE
jgi:hypothetical protein